MFNNPEIFGALPCKHNFTPSHETVYTGFFFPAYRMHFDYIDPVRGVTDEEKAKADFETRRNAKLDNPQAYLEYCSEYCFTPDEALVRQGENQFNQILLAEQMAQLTIHKTVTEPTRGFLMGGNSDGKGGTNPIHWKPDMNGDILLLEEPERDEAGNSIKNLYCAGIDSIDMGTNDSTGQLDVSDFCIVILKRMHGIKEPKIVCVYKDRPRDIRTAYDNAFRLLDWYNSKVVVENSRTNIITYAREKKKLHYFMTRPRATITNLKTNTTMIGAPPTEGVVRHYLQLIEEFINDYCHTIAYKDVLDELMKYTYENKRKFDIVASLGMALLADEELFAAPIQSVTKLKSEWRDFGYYTDANGRKRYGAIPKRNNDELRQGEINIQQALDRRWM